MTGAVVILGSIRFLIRHRRVGMQLVQLDIVPECHLVRNDLHSHQIVLGTEFAQRQGRTSPSMFLNVRIHALNLIVLSSNPEAMCLWIA